MIARKRRGLAAKRLAALVELSDRRLRSFESGEVAPPPETLERVARVLRFPVEFFLQPQEPHNVEPNAASFRALSIMTARQREAVLAAAALAIELQSFIDARFELPEVDVPDLREMEPEAAAQYLRERWRLGERPIANMVHLLEAHGVRVFSLDREYASVDAFTFWWGDRPFVFLNTLKTGERGRFDAAHELGHLVLHRHGIPQGPPLEAQADRFGSAFLLPASRMRAIAPRHPTLQRLVELKLPWRVSVAALARRFRDLGVLSDWHYKQVCIDLARRGRKNEPSPISRETSSLLRQVFDALRAKGMGLAEIARQLRLDRSDVSGLVFGLVATTVSGGGAGAGLVGPRTLRLVEPGG